MKPNPNNLRDREMREARLKGMPLMTIDGVKSDGCSWGYALATVATLYVILFVPLALLIGAVEALS